MYLITDCLQDTFNLNWWFRMEDRHTALTVTSWLSIIEVSSMMYSLLKGNVVYVLNKYCNIYLNLQESLLKFWMMQGYNDVNAFSLFCIHFHKSSDHRSNPSPTKRNMEKKEGHGSSTKRMGKILERYVTKLPVCACLI